MFWKDWIINFVYASADAWYQNNPRGLKCRKMWINLTVPRWWTANFTIESAQSITSWLNNLNRAWYNFQDNISIWGTRKEAKKSSPSSFLLFNIESVLNPQESLLWICIDWHRDTINSHPPFRIPLFNSRGDSSGNNEKVVTVAE